MIRTWIENVRMWGFGAVLDLGDDVAFLELRLGPYRVMSMWMDSRSADRLAERLMERLREDS